MTFQIIAAANSRNNAIIFCLGQ